MGDLDQFAKTTFALDTEEITGGAIVWGGPQEAGLSEVRLDGLLSVLAPDRVSHLPSPWNDARRHADVVVEVKMPGDHLDVLAVRRADLRRAAWHVRRIEKENPRWEGGVGLWVVAPHLPEVLGRLFEIVEKAPGCYAVGFRESPFLWVAANELPLHEALVPFLIARSGKRLLEFVRWIVERRPRSWSLSMLRYVPMDEATKLEILRRDLDPAHLSPQVREQQAWLARQLLELMPDLRDEITLVEAKKNLRIALARRGLALTPEQSTKIDACSDVVTVERWHERAITAASAEEALS